MRNSHVGALPIVGYNGVVSSICTRSDMLDYLVEMLGDMKAKQN